MAWWRRAAKRVIRLLHQRRSSRHRMVPVPVPVDRTGSFPRCLPPTMVALARGKAVAPRSRRASGAVSSRRSRAPWLHGPQRAIAP